MIVAAIPAHLRRYAGTGVWSDQTIGTLARTRADRDPDRVIYLGEPTSPTYASLLADGEALARALLDLGLVPGDCIAFQVPNWVEAAVINLAAGLAGLVVSPIVPIYRDAEAGWMLRDSRTRVMFVADVYRNYDFAAMVDRLRPGLPDLVHVAHVRPVDRPDGLGALLVAGRFSRRTLPVVDPDAVKLRLYTSGTTGMPKAVLHSHNTLNRVAQVSAEQAGSGSDDITLMPSPVTHISGYSGALERPFVIGARVVLMERWDAAQAVALIDRHGVTSTVAATPFLKELCDQAHLAGRRLPTFRRFACGGAAVPADLVLAANAALAQPCAGRVYGSSEVPLVTHAFDPVTQGEAAAHTDGRLVDYEVQIVDEAGALCAIGQEGEILARGPSMFLGYADPAQTEQALTADGFFRTGDLGTLDANGAICITGRKKDLIIRGGENISAKEIEDVLLRHPAIADAAVVAMPHPRLGEGICAFLVRRGTQRPDPDEIGAFVLGEGLARQKCPERIVWIDALPQTASGKVRKDVLRSMAKDTAEG
jgi:acyl-CoA synthetase (AMP-forming)/AMP-acid ligase II